MPQRDFSLIEKIMGQRTEKNISTRIPVLRGQRVKVTINDQPVEAYAGETVAIVLMTSGHEIFQHSNHDHTPRTLYCGMGVCFNCLVTIDGVPNVRACATKVSEGMAIETRGDE
jgi:sarcosine oxidase subunit alpha